MREDRLRVYNEMEEAFKKRSIEENLDETIKLLERAYCALYHLAKVSSGVSNDHLPAMRFIAIRAQKVGEVGKCLEGISNFVMDEDIHLA